MNKKKNSGPKKAKNRIKKDLQTFFTRNMGEHFNLRQIRAHLDVNSETDKIHLENAMFQLVDEKHVLVDEHDKFYVPKPVPKIVVGRVDMTKNGSAFVVAEDWDSDIFVSNKNMGGAFDGDKVQVELTKKGREKRPEGRIAAVLERSKTRFVCTLQMLEKFAFGIPDDRKMQVDFFIPLHKIAGAKNGDKVLVRLINFSPDEKNPIGEVVEVLGRPGDHETEMKAILFEHNLDGAFPPKVEEAADRISTTISAEEIKKRSDFRKICTFTIDPFDAKDFDDALSYRKLENGNHEIGVHIADVSHYVRPDDAIDREALRRATSVYLVDRVLPMLPEKLSNGLCSLRPNEEKLCFTAVFVMNDQAEIQKHWFGKTVIYSDRRFTYEEAQERIETKTGDYADEINVLDGLAKIMRADRFRHGAISFDREEVKFKLDEFGKPIEIITKVSLDAHKLIEEFMLLANRMVAEHFAEKVKSKNRPPFVYRVHDHPNETKLNGLQSMAARFGYMLRFEDPKKVSSEINRLLTESKDKPEHNMLATLSIRTMAKAKYTTKNMGHYGLAFPFYTHFTSPIRRYPDMMVHRLLEHYLTGHVPTDTARLEDDCMHASDMEVKAEEAERDSVKYKQVEYMKPFTGDEFDGLISGVSEYMLYVELSNKCEGGVRLSELTDDHYSYDEANYRVVGVNKRRVYKLGDPVRVRILNCDVAKRQIDMDIIIPKKKR